MKKISIVLPVYNGEEFLQEAIESILNQTWKNFQLIIVDDCSNDNTPDIIRRYVARDKRIVAVKNEQNCRLPQSLNIGFRLADGEYFTWTSDDNLYAPNTFEILANYLDKNSACGLVYADMISIDKQRKILRKRSSLETDQLLYGNPVGACFLYRKEIAKAVGEYDTNLFLAEDYDYWLRIYQICEIVHLKHYLYYYRVHEKSLTNTRHNEIRLQTGKVLDKHFQYIKNEFSTRRSLYKFLDIYVYYKGKNGPQIVKQLKKEYLTYGTYRIIVRGLYRTKKELFTIGRIFYKKIVQIF